MSGQTVGAAVAIKDRQNQFIDWIHAQQREIAMVAASHIKPSAVVRVVHGALRTNPKLMAAAIANPQSLLSCMLDAARLGHEPDTDDYYLVPFGNEVTGIEGYKGIIERMFRAGGVTSVVAQIVRRADHYDPQGQFTPPVHEYPRFASKEKRGPMIGAYAFAIFTSGACSQVIEMGEDEIMEHKAKSRGSDKADSPWQCWPEKMWKKTVLRSLEPYVPTSTEYRFAPPPVVGVVRTDAGTPVPVTASQSARLAEQGIETDIADAVIVGDTASDQGAKQEAPAAPVTAQQVNDLFRKLGFGVKDVDEVKAAALAIAGRSLPIRTLADLDAGELTEVRDRLAGLKQRGDVMALLAQISMSKGDAGPDSEAAGE